MDELDMIRDLGEELEHEPPASLARHRDRLLDGARRRRGPSRWTLLGVAAAVTAAAILVPALVLDGGGAAPAGPGPTAPAAGRAMNVLILGTDTRGERDGRPPRSDTMMLVHVPADRRHVRAVSVPRDSLVRIPACAAGGERGTRGRLGSVFTMGGVPCTVRTLESLTGVRIDRSVVIDFTGFRRLVDALGGVRLTLPRPVADPAAGLRLPAGEQRLDGRQALAYVRARYRLGDGSDLARIERQQRFMAALAREVRERMQGDPVRFAKFLAVLPGAVRATPGLRAGELPALARSFGTGGPIEFDTVPVRPASRDPNGLEWDAAGARRVFDVFKTR